jgi:GT2 family glycosyltransferase
MNPADVIRGDMGRRGLENMDRHAPSGTRRIVAAFGSMRHADTLAILVAYENTDELSGALESLDGWCDALVIDNGVDDRARAVANAHGAEYLTPGRNIGFAAAANIGLRRRDGRHVLLLNPDARVTGDALVVLGQALADDGTLCAAAPRLRGMAGDDQKVAWPVPSPREEWVKAFCLQRFSPPAMTFLIGAVLLLRDEAIRDVGLFDERFFLYAEECDWQLRAQRRGWKVRLVEEAVARHRGGGSSNVESRRKRLFHESAELFAVKWYGERGWANMRTASRIGSALRVIATIPSRERRTRYLRQLRQ